MKALTGRQLEQARDALVAGFPSWDDLDELATFGLEVPMSLATDVAPNSLPARPLALKLLQYCQEQGWHEMLLREALRQRPRQPALRAICAELGLAPAPFARPDTHLDQALAGMPSAPSPGRWRQRLVECERAVCQVLFRGSAVGTGFLVAPQRILTNWHVLAQPEGAAAPADAGLFAARFDFRCADGAAEADAGFLIPLAPRQLEDASPPDQLDYAIADLAQALPDHRAPLAMGQRGLQAGEAILVLQHPAARTLELAHGRCLGWVPGRDDSVYAHDAETEGGSSGSPCFGLDLTLLAIHHYREAAQRKRAVATEAVLGRLGGLGRLDLVTL